MKITNKVLVPLVVFVAAVCVFGAYFVSNIPSESKSVFVYKDGELIRTLSIKDESYEVDLGTNVILVESDGVTMINAKCPDKLCVKQGKIKNSSHSIVCLPNRIAVEIGGRGGEVDAVAGR